jgi:23S rRNA pseudouridine955/2504/2580 synthase/23S rRNA pseudouridine1911/1915/1917 synthase
VRAIRRALDAGACRVNGHIETFGSRKLVRGEIVEFFIPAQHQRDHDFDPRRLIHDADDIIAYDKPPGLPVTPDDAGRKWNLESLLKAHFGGLVIAVHRLDADTSGIVLFARSEKAARRLEEAFREHQVKKTYLALVRGHPRESGEFRSYLVKQASQKGQERWASGRGSDAREAITTWTVQERVGAFASLVEVQPKTGRYHQIRIHFSEMGHPIYGDRQYGDRQDPIHVTRHLLHAWTVEVPHPAGAGTITLKTAFPPDLAEAMKLLRHR